MISFKKKKGIKKRGTFIDIWGSIGRNEKTSEEGTFARCN